MTCMSFKLRPQVAAASTLRSPECALKVRVGANSPSLWPTMFSLISTGMCWRPLWTAMVTPTISGTTTERRDQVLIGVRIALTGLAFPATVRVIDRVHGEPAHRRTHAAPALGARLAVAAQVVLVVPHLAERGAAVDVHLAGLAGLQAQVRVDALARGE